MKKQHLILAGLAPLFLAACASGPTAEQQANYAAEARGSAGKLVKTLLGELKKDIDTIGADGAIGVCKDKAPQIAGKIAKEDGVMIKRVTHKNRNAQRSTPDEWETKALQELEKQLASGTAATNLEYYQVVEDKDGKKMFRYAKGLVIGELCMNCHGTKETIPPAVQAKLATEYPNDKATGYMPNQFRGAISIKRPL